MVSSVDEIMKTSYFLPENGIFKYYLILEQAYQCVYFKYEKTNLFKFTQLKGTELRLIPIPSCLETLTQAYHLFLEFIFTSFEHTDLN